jgi:hypothetical protein
MRRINPRIVCARRPLRKIPRLRHDRPGFTLDIGRGRHTQSTVGLTRRRRGRENSPSLPTIRGMTVVDRPTISGQFLGRFHAHGLPNKWKMPSIYRHFCTRPRRTRRSASARLSFRFPLAQPAWPQQVGSPHIIFIALPSLGATRPRDGRRSPIGFPGETIGKCRLLSLAVQTPSV